jgi:hypothetical protein
MSKAWTPKPALITPERLQRLSGKQFRAIQELVEAEEQRRLSATLVTYVTPGRGGASDASAP